MCMGSLQTGRSPNGASVARRASATRALRKNGFASTATPTRRSFASAARIPTCEDQGRFTAPSSRAAAIAAASRRRLVQHRAPERVSVYVLAVFRLVVFFFPALVACAGSAPPAEANEPAFHQSPGAPANAHTKRAPCTMGADQT